MEKDPSRSSESPSLRAARNRTLTVDDAEVSTLERALISLRGPAEPEELVDRIINQDYTEAVRFLPPEVFDLIIIDPPYNLTKDFDGTRFNRMPHDEYRRWFEERLLPLKRCLKKTAAIYVCSDWQTSALIQPVLAEHFIIRNRITWEREKGRGAARNWKNCSEDIWFCTVSDSYYFDVESVKSKKRVIAPYRHPTGNPKDWHETKEGNYRLTHPSNLWSDITIPFWSMPENTDHPTQKPEKLIAKLILASSRPGDLIFDPFLGSGTTAVVAAKLDRRYTGIEINRNYCLLALKRLERAKADSSIQGYGDGVFWERNSVPASTRKERRSP